MKLPACHLGPRKFLVDSQMYSKNISPPTAHMLSVMPRVHHGFEVTTNGCRGILNREHYKRSRLDRQRIMKVGVEAGGDIEREVGYL